MLITSLEQAAHVEELNEECVAMLELEKTHCPDCGAELVNIEGSLFCTDINCCYIKLNP